MRDNTHVMGSKIYKRGMVFVTSALLCVSMFGNVMKVSATDADATATEASASTEAVSTEAATTTAAATSTTEENTSNIDPNGTLGKNSDVGVVVTESITGVAGQDVTISFSLNSGNAAAIKIKGVYPVIDTAFPFETSGDAYKVTAAGEDPNLQLSLPAVYTLKARSDLKDGYQSVRFIGEYSKLTDDGVTFKDYYVIKTINIYFSSTVTTEATTEADTSSSKSKKKSETTTEISTDSDDSDDDSGSTYSPGYSGGTSGDEESTAPKLIIEGFDTDPAKVMAGDSFKMTIHITNSSKTTNVCNGKFLIGDEAGNFLPTSGSNAVFVEKIGAGETGDIEIELKTSAELAQKNYRVILKGDFDDGKGNSYTATESVYLPIYQEVKMNVTDVTMTPESIGIGSSGSLVFTINNQGSAGIYNVSVSTDDGAVSAPESYVGNIAPNSSAYATLEVTGKKDNQDKGTIKVKISYEDSEGTKGELEQAVACVVGVDSYNEYNDYDEYEDEYEEGIPWWIWLIIGIIAVGAIIAVAIILLKKRKKKLRQMLEDEDSLDDELFGNETVSEKSGEDDGDTGIDEDITDGTAADIDD